MNIKTAEEMYQKHFLYGHDGIHDIWEKQVAQQIFDEQITPLKKRIEELEDKFRTVTEMIKADKSSAIELQEQEQDEDFNRGREEAFDYVLELINPSTNGK